MRLKICLSVVIVLCAYTNGFAIKETNKITSKEWHCTNICKAAYGEPFFDKLTEKCYCSLRKSNSLEDKNSRDAMKINAKIHELYLILKEIPEPSNRVRREEPTAEENTTSKTEIIQSTVTSETVTTAPEPIVANINPESTSNIPTTSENTIVEATNTKPKNNISKNTIERKPRPFQKIAGARKSAAVQDKPIDDLVAEAQQKVEEFVVVHRQNPKEAQTRIKDIQGTFNRVASRLKHDNEPPTLQERINQFEERIASRHIKPTSSSTLIVEPTNLGETNPEENLDDTIIASRRHPVHRQRIPPRRIILHNNEENTRPRPRFIPRRLRDRVAAKNPIETTTQIAVESKSVTETAQINTETIAPIVNEVSNSITENTELNPVNNEV